jgi:hypothetical protein
VAGGIASPGASCNRPRRAGDRVEIPGKTGTLRIGGTGCMVRAPPIAP